LELGFEGLVVLALDLEFGLEFFYQEIEARDFGAEAKSVVCGGTGWRLRLRQLLRGVGGRRGGVLHWSRGLRWCGWWKERLGGEGVGEGAGPG
jgi:hypothetical protein